MNTAGDSDHNGGTVSLSECTISGNSIDSGLGGGIAIDGGTATLTDCTITANSAPAGGGIGVIDDGSLTLSNSTISGNTRMKIAQRRPREAGCSPASARTRPVTDCTFENNYSYGGVRRDRQRGHDFGLGQHARRQ